MGDPRQTTSMEYDVEAIRREFPIFEVRPHGKPLVYLDNAATSQKPNAVIDATSEYYAFENANVHRGVHYLSQIATDRYEGARESVRRFLNVPDTSQVIFTGNNTDAINLVANAFGQGVLQEGDEVLISEMEHHSNIVPWQMLRDRMGIVLKVAPIDDRGDIRMDEFEKLLSPRTKLVAVVYVSNALGTINPVEEIIRLAHANGTPVLVDSAQAAPHMPIDVQALDCDFLSFAPHKALGPTGIGVLYGKREWLEKLPPFRGGGDMIAKVTFEETTYNTLPYKFEAGTPNIAGAAGLGAAVEYLMALGMDRVQAYESDLLAYATERVAEVTGLQLVGTARRKAAVLGFTMENAHPHDIGQILDNEGVAIRAGHHCAQPVMQHFGVAATARASLALYNTRDDVDALVNALQRVHEVFS